MIVEKFFETLTYIVDLDEELGLQSALGAIVANLNNIVNAPAQPQLQSALASALGAFAKAADGLNETLSPAQYEAISAIGGADFFDPGIAEKVQASISANAMTPSVAKNFVQDLATRRARFLDTVKETRSGLMDLGVTSYTLTEGSAGLAFVIPRELFKNHLASFATELRFISRLIGHVSEALTGTTEPVILETLSTSTPTISLLASIPVIASLATIVGNFLGAWERIEKIRKIREELSEIGGSSVALDEMTDKITTTVNEVVEESTEITIRNYKGDTARRNELENAIRQDTHRLFGQIERGLTIQFKTEPKESASEVDRNELKTIKQASLLQFPRRTEQPMLMTNGEILDGDLETFKVVKRTKTEKTTTTHKEKEPSRRIKV